MSVIRFPRPGENRVRGLPADAIGEELVSLAHRLADLGQMIGREDRLDETVRVAMLRSLCTANVEIREVAMAYVQAHRPEGPGDAGGSTG
jgi:hypothetical protein